MAETAEEIAAFVTALRTNQCGENMGCGVMPTCACSAMDDAAAIIERQAAEITRLQSGGCARDQSTTQYCAEAAAFAAEVAELRAEVERLTRVATFLWDRLDAIDTVSDMVKADDDAAYRKLVERQQARRFEVGTVGDDGCTLTFTDAPLPPAPEAPDA